MNVILDFILEEDRTGNEYLSGPPPDFIIPGFAARTWVTVLVGREGSGKTSLMLYLIRAMVKYTKFLGLETAHGNVVFMNLDSMPPALIRQRLDELELTEKDLKKTIWFDQQVDLSADFGQGPICELLGERWRKKEVKIIIIDALSALTFNSGVQSENDSIAMTGVLRSVRRLAVAANAAVIVLHHVAKSAGTVRDGIEIPFEGRGSTAIAGAVDIVLTFQGKIKDSIIIAEHKSRGHDIQIFPIEINPGGVVANDVEPSGDPIGAWKALIEDNITDVAMLTRAKDWCRRMFITLGYVEDEETLSITYDDMSWMQITTDLAENWYWMQMGMKSIGAVKTGRKPHTKFTLIDKGLVEKYLLWREKRAKKVKNEQY